MNRTFTKETQPASEAGQLLLDAFDKSWDRYRTELKHCRDQISEASVHDLRVATRRLLALIELLRAVVPRRRLKKMRRRFKKQLDGLDELRDTQVILAEISKLIAELPQLQGFQQQLKSRQEKMLRELPKTIRDFDTPKLRRRIRRTRDSIEADGDGSLQARLLQTVDNAYLRVRRRLDCVDADRTATIHRVRIAFKSLRYMIELIHPLLADFPAENLKMMDAYQSRMGEVQDMEVLEQALADYSESASLTDAGAVRGYFERRHAEAISGYLQNMDQLNRFWRPAPDQPFPWEKPALS